MPLALVLPCLGILALSVAGGVMPLLGRFSHSRLQLYLSFAAGAMLGAAFFHMLPEAAESVSPASPRLAFWGWMAFGLFSLFFLERFFAYHHHEVANPGEHNHRRHNNHPAAHAHEAPQRRIDWWAAAVGLTVHSLTEGFALGSVAGAGASPLTQSRAMLGVFLAVILHKPADSLTVVTLMVRDGWSRGWAHAVNVLYGLAVPLGVVLFWSGRQLLGRWGAGPAAFSGKILAFSAGTFLCVALADLLPELQFHAHDRWKLSLALLGGLGLMYATAVLG